MTAILLALLAAGQAVPATPAQAAPGSLQQRFDAASAAAAAGKCAEAITAFEAIEASGAAKRNRLVGAAIDVRKGRCLVGLDRTAEGEAAIRRGLPELRARGADFALDVREGQITLGMIAAERLDYDAAMREYQVAADVSQGIARVAPLLAISRLLMFDRDGRALKLAEEANALVQGGQASKRDVATVQTQYARVLLNQGQDKEAYRVLRDSLAKQGGLDLRVNLDDLSTRSDLAIAALRNKDVESARKYLAYTGAGRLPKASFESAAQMDVPVCDPAAGLRPDDVAIVEFSIADGGYVVRATPIFATGGRSSAIAFARAVSEWSWRAESVKAIPPLFRYATRVELHCRRTPNAPGDMQPVIEANLAWLYGTGPAPAWRDLPDARALPLQRATLAAADAGGNRKAGLGAVMALLANSTLPPAERDPLGARALSDAQALGAPPAFTVFLRISKSPWEDADAYRQELRSLLVDPATAADPLVVNTLRLRIAAPAYRKRAPADAPALLDAVIDDPRLGGNDRLKVAATLQRANLLAAAGDIAGAEAMFRRTGLTGEQCALLDLSPAPTRSAGSSADYPTEALAMGFEGWVRVEFDVTPDGRTATQRAVIAYPPFVFNDAATGIARGTRWTSTYRPEGALSCSGMQRGIVFRIP